MRYLVIIEKAKKNYSAYVPDLPGCIATGSTKKKAQKNISEAIEFHLDGMKEDRVKLPRPSAEYTYIEATI